MGKLGAFLLGLLNLSIQNEKCCENDICFTKAAPFDDMPLPKCPEEIRPLFKMYSRDNRFLPEFIYPDTIPESLNGTRDTIFIVHGYMHDFSDLRVPDWDKNLRNKFINQDDANVILVNWSRGSTDLYYPASASNTRSVGAQLALVAETLTTQGGAARDKMWCIGHSLGAHVCGHAGQRYKFGRITGLDPAGPWFENKNWTVGLNPASADFVDVWHTHGEKGLTLLHFGTMKPLGYVDFYVNGGGQQPGCRVGDLIREGRRHLERARSDDQGEEEQSRQGSSLFGISLPKPQTDILPDCSHMRVLTLFEESLSDDCEFPVTKQCTNPQDIPRSCQPVTNNTQQAMGPSAVDLPGRGLFLLRTGSTEPYCKLSPSN